MTSFEQRFEEIEKDLILFLLIEMMEVLLMEMTAKYDAAIVLHYAS